LYKEVLEENSVKQTPDFTLSILSYEVGKLHQIKVYKERFGSTGFIGDERIELGDTITMAKLLIEQKGHNVAEVELEGLERFKKRIKDVKEAELKKKYGDK